MSDFDEPEPREKSLSQRMRVHVRDASPLRRVLLAAVASAPLSGPMLWKGIEVTLDAHTKWHELLALPDRVRALEKELEITKGLRVDREERIHSLERYRCVIGWDPPKSVLPRDKRGECRANLQEMAAPAPPP